jgi:hypothetical protein
LALCVLALCALLTGALWAPSAVAANAPNPDPSLIARWEPCEPGVGVTVIVDRHRLGDEKIYLGCAVGAQPNGVAALQNAGFDIEGVGGGLAFICRIDGQPTFQEQTCENTPGANSYWAYLVGRPGGQWGYSNVGATNPSSAAAVDSVQGWSFGETYPRIEPMNGAGPSGFVLPPAQESSVAPAVAARKWLLGAVRADAQGESEGELTLYQVFPQLLESIVAVRRAEVDPIEFDGLVQWLESGCGSSCLLRSYSTIDAPVASQSANSMARAVLALGAMGQNPSDFAGLDFRDPLAALINPSTGKVRSGAVYVDSVLLTAPTVEALAATGPLPDSALKTIDLMISDQDASSGSLTGGPGGDLTVVRALLAARAEMGAAWLGPTRSTAIQTALEEEGEFLEGMQEADGGIPGRPNPEPIDASSLASTAAGAVALALTGHREAAKKAAKWVSRYQVTAEYAGAPDPVTGEPAPAEGLIGAFLPEEVALRAALAYGLEPGPGYGLNGPAVKPTAEALEALIAAGPYGPLYASFDQGSLWFNSRQVGSMSTSQSATLTNEDPRSLEIGEAGLVGENAGDFRLDATTCEGRSLASGESCELSVRFSPTATGTRQATAQLALEGTDQTLDLSLGGTGVAIATPGGEQQPAGTPPTRSLEQPTMGQVRLRAPRIERRGTARGLIAVSWKVLDPGVGVRRWQISAERLGAERSRSEVVATGTAGTSALLRLAPGFAYRLRLTVTDRLGRESGATIGTALVPRDDRAEGLSYSGRWRRHQVAAAWLQTVSEGRNGASVHTSVPAGRPVISLLAGARTALIEVRSRSGRQVFRIARRDHGSAEREVVVGRRESGGPLTVKVLGGAVDFDGISVEP